MEFKSVIHLHTCGVCGKESQWDDSWSWNGTYADLDDGKPVKKVCSDECYEKAEENMRKVKATKSKVIINRHKAAVIATRDTGDK